MKTIQTWSILGACALALTLGAAEPLVLEKLECSGKPGSVLGADVPFRGNFTQTGLNQAAAVQTRVKMFHDGKYIYAGVEADEPDMAKLKAEPVKVRPLIWTNDTIEINYDPDGRNVLLGKIFIDTAGQVVDLFGVDDHTGKETFVVDPCRESRTRVISIRKYDGKWTMELAIPIGIFYYGAAKETFAPRLNIARNRWAGNFEASDLFPVADKLHAKPRFFPTLVLKDFNAADYNYQIEGVTAKCAKKDGRLIAAVAGKLRNPGKRFRSLKVTARLLDPRGTLLAEKTAGVAALPGKLVDFKLELEPEKLGRAKIEVQLSDLTGALLANQVIEQHLSWSPISIKVTEPAYRNNIYASMPEVKKIKAEIRLTENIGKPLTVTLTGPDYRQSVEIPAAREVNQVEFPFENTALGSYTLKAGEISTTIRKLPPHQGEVWLDRKGIAYVDGKKFFSFGTWASGVEYYQLRLRGVNTENTSAIFSKPEEIKAYLDRHHALGVKVALFPYMEPDRDKKILYFNDAGRTPGKLTDKQKEILRTSIAVMKDHPATLAYYMADEPEGWGHNEDWYADCYDFIRELDPYHPMTITNFGTEGRRRFHHACDILWSDTYPNYYTDGTYDLGRRSNFEAMSHASKLRPAWNLVQSFDWGRFSAKGAPDRGPTFDEIREQTYGALLGNAKSIMQWCYDSWGNYNDDLRVTRYHLGAELDSLKDLLLEDTEFTVKTSGNFDAKDLLCGMKRFGADKLVIAINLSEKPMETTFESAVPLEDKLYVAGTDETVAVRDRKIFRDTLMPHVVKLYVTGNVERDAVNLAAIREEVRKLTRERKKPGNLMYGGVLSHAQMIQYKQGKVFPGIPRITCSSELNIHHPKLASQYFLQDGIRKTEPYQIMTWTPNDKDPDPWVEVDFGREVVINRTVLYMGGDEKWFGIMHDGTFLVEENGSYREVAKVVNNRKDVLEVTFEPVKTRKLRLKIERMKFRWMRTFHEWEVYGPDNPGK